jgi:hypothetical protein
MSETNSAWRNEAVPWVREIFGEMRQQFKLELGPLAKTEVFLGVFFSARRETLELVKRLSTELDELDRILTDVSWVLKNAQTIDQVKSQSIGLLARIESHLRKSRIDACEQWQDGPGTAEGCCWVCAFEGNVRWLADPLDSEPRDKEPWCIKCYRIRKKKANK